MQDIEFRVKHMVKSLDYFRNRQVMSRGVNHESTPLEWRSIFNADGQSSNLIVILLISFEQLRESFEAPQKSRVVVGVESQALSILDREGILFVIDFSGDEETSISDVNVKGNIASLSVPRAFENLVEVVLNHGVDFSLLRASNHVLQITGTHPQNLTMGIGLEGDWLRPDSVGCAGSSQGDGSDGQEEEE